MALRHPLAAQSPTARSPTRHARDGSLAAQSPTRRRAIDYRALLPERFDVDAEQCWDLESGLELCQGRRGTVVAARDRDCEGRRVVAVKTVVKRCPSDVEAFHREAGVMRELDHPNICRLFEIFESQTHLFLVMELCRGGTLLNRILTQGDVSEALSAGLVMQVLYALRYAHDRGIAHLDLKPGHVCFCTPDAKDVKVIDWGRSPGDSVYAAPDLLSQAVAYRTGQDGGGCASDMWSLGVLTHVLLCGSAPWRSGSGGSQGQGAEGFLNGEPWDTVISGEAKSFVRKLLQHDPARRPKSPELIEDNWLVKCQEAHGNISIYKGSAAVLRNLQSFSRQSLFRSMCIATIAKQLDHTHLQELQRVFQSLDASGDGVLQLEEVRRGFKQILGSDCPGSAEVDDLFNAVDLEGSGSIDFTEFVAAGLGQRASQQDDALWAAFRSLDRNVNGRRSSDDLTDILAETDVQQAFSMRGCGEAAREVLRKWDRDADGGIDFEEFKALIFATAQPEPGAGASRHVPEAKLAALKELGLSVEQAVSLGINVFRLGIDAARSDADQISSLVADSGREACKRDVELGADAEACSHDIEFGADAEDIALGKALNARGEELTLDKVFSAIRMTLRGEVATLQAVKDEPVEQGEVITVQVDKLRFTQSGCSERFFDGRPLEATIGAILGGAVDPLSAEWLVLRVVKRNGMLLSMDNRRLYCLKEAQRRTRLRDAARDVWVRAQVYTWDPVLDTFLQHLDHDCWGGAGATITVRKRARHW